MEFDKEYFEKRRGFFTEIKSLFYAFLIKLFLKPKKLLDVGCAEGKLIKWAMRLGIKASGVDISNKGFKLAPALVRGKCQKGDILNLPFKNNQFEAVSCLALLEHIKKTDVDRALAELLRVTKKYVLLQICVKDNPFEGEHYLLDPTHVNVEESDWWVKKFKELKIKTKFSPPILGLFLLEKENKDQSQSG